MTVVFGITFLVLCPENPQTCSFLTPREKRVALERVRGNKASLGSRVFKWDQFLEAILPWRDLQGWAYRYVQAGGRRSLVDLFSLLALTLAIPNGGIGNCKCVQGDTADESVLHLILQSYGYGPFQTILMGLPQAVMQVFFPLSGAYIARQFPNCRLYVIMAYVGTG
jgi:ACS family allantoate permease-like MFS transporter